MFVCLWNNQTQTHKLNWLKLNNYFIFLCVFEISKLDQTKANQTQSNKPNQTHSKKNQNHLFCRFFQTISQNQTFSAINSKLTAWNKIKSKLHEKLARAAQLLYRPVLVFKLFIFWFYSFWLFISKICNDKIWIKFL